MIANIALDGDGGGLLVSGDSKVVLQVNATISHNSAEKNGGGVHVWLAKVEGQTCTDSRIRFQHLHMEGNAAQTGDGGGFFSMDHLTLMPNGTSMLTQNMALMGRGGALALSDALLQMQPAHVLHVADNFAQLHGGGVALLAGASIEMIESAPCPDACSAKKRGDGHCNPACMRVECNWDEGDCGRNQVSVAGIEAQKTCNRDECSYAIQTQDAGLCSDKCFTAACDWSRDLCSDSRNTISTCPLIDASAFASIKKEQRESVQRTSATGSPHFLNGGNSRGFGRCRSLCMQPELPPTTSSMIRDGWVGSSSLALYGHVLKTFTLGTGGWLHAAQPTIPMNIPINVSGATIEVWVRVVQEMLWYKALQIKTSSRASKLGFLVANANFAVALKSEPPVTATVLVSGLSASCWTLPSLSTDGATAGTFDDGRGVLMREGLKVIYTENYEHSIKCEWIIRASKVPSRISLRMTFLDLEPATNCDRDYLSVGTGDLNSTYFDIKNERNFYSQGGFNSSYSHIDRICGSSIPNMSYTSETGVLVLTLVSDAGNGKGLEIKQNQIFRGFEAEWSVTAAVHSSPLFFTTTPPTHQCSQIADMRTTSIGVIGDGPGSFHGLSSCSWIVAPGNGTGFQDVTLFFTEFMLSEDDRLSLYSCSDILCVEKSAATSHSGGNVPASFTSSTPVLLVVLERLQTTRSGVSSVGFTASYAGTRASTMLENGAWQHVAYVFNARGRVSLLIDGVTIFVEEIGYGVVPTAPFSGSQFDTAIGGRSPDWQDGGTSGYLSALVDELRFWHTQRTAKEIAAQRFTQCDDKSLSQSLDLVSCYDFDVILSAPHIFRDSSRHQLHAFTASLHSPYLPWCENIDDNGILILDETKVASSQSPQHNEGMAKMWGYCNQNKIRLPGAGYNYSEIEMTKAATHIAQHTALVLQGYSGCGHVPLRLLRNTAQFGNGGAIYFDSCLRLDKKCFLGGIDALSSTRAILLHDNAAQSGGAVFVACHHIGQCAGTFDDSNTIGSLPLLRKIEFEGNVAVLYGNTVASHASLLVWHDTSPSGLEIVPVRANVATAVQSGETGTGERVKLQGGGGMIC